MDTLSIIIPNFNNERWLSVCLESCLGQKGDFKKEIIVVDDHSTDKSWEILEKFQQKHPNEIFIYKNPTKGGNQARNHGFKQSSGGFIQWLDSDDSIVEGKLDAQHQYFLKNPNTDIVYSDWRMDFYENDVKVREEVKIEKEYDSFLYNLITDNWQPPLSYLLRRSFAKKLDDIQAWNPKTKVAQDREYFTLAAVNQAQFNYVPGLYSVYNRWSDQTVSSMNYQKRLEYNLGLEYAFSQRINEQSWMDPKMKKKLISVLKTQALKACYYSPKLRIKEGVSFNEICWDQIHYKMRFVIPFVWVWQNVKFRLG